MAGGELIVKVLCLPFSVLYVSKLSLLIGVSYSQTLTLAHSLFLKWHLYLILLMVVDLVLYLTLLSQNVWETRAQYLCTHERVLAHAHTHTHSFAICICFDTGGTSHYFYRHAFITFSVVGYVRSLFFIL